MRPTGTSWQSMRCEAVMMTFFCGGQILCSFKCSFCLSKGEFRVGSMAADIWLGMSVEQLPQMTLSNSRSLERALRDAGPIFLCYENFFAIVLASSKLDYGSSRTATRFSRKMAIFDLAAVATYSLQVSVQIKSGYHSPSVPKTRDIALSWTHGWDYCTPPVFQTVSRLTVTAPTRSHMSSCAPQIPALIDDC